MRTQKNNSARKAAREFVRAPAEFQTPGYEKMELSTQIVIAEALKRGVTVEVLDDQNQFLRLRKGDHTEYVESATKTSRDSYVTSLILGNKVVTKILLKEKGIRVPEGKHYSNYRFAAADAKDFVKSGKSYVVKPKTTNYGIGISILHGQAIRSALLKALNIAFEYDSSVLVEEFIPGIECRFLVIGGKCVAVLNRVPANVIGDGKHTIRELVDIKNDDPLRGKGHRTPLEIIQLGETELNVLKQQNLTPESVPKKDEQIFLRRNSNVSTGGDSIDYTDVVSEEYKRIAEKAALAVDAKICGVDMISEAFEGGGGINGAVRNSAATYAIIELNYNPAIHLHNFPFKGKNRNIGKYILDLLGF